MLFTAFSSCAFSARVQRFIRVSIGGSDTRRGRKNTKPIKDQPGLPRTEADIRHAQGAKKGCEVVVATFKHIF